MHEIFDNRIIVNFLKILKMYCWKSSTMRKLMLCSVIISNRRICFVSRMVAGLKCNGRQKIACLPFLWNPTSASGCLDIVMMKHDGNSHFLNVCLVLWYYMLIECFLTLQVCVRGAWCIYLLTYSFILVWSWTCLNELSRSSDPRFIDCSTAQ